MNSQGPQRDRRTTTRTALGRPVRLQFDDALESEQGTCDNISTGGMFVACEALRPVGSLVRFELRIDQEQVVRGLGEVIWQRAAGSRSGGGQPAGLGIRFRFLEKTDRQQILKLLSEEIKRRLENMPLAVESAEASSSSRRASEGADRTPLESPGASQPRAAIGDEPHEWYEPKDWRQAEGEGGDSAARESEHWNRDSVPVSSDDPRAEQWEADARDGDEFDAALADLTDEGEDAEVELPERLETTSIPLAMPSEPIPDLVLDSRVQKTLETASPSPTAPRLSRLRRPRSSVSAAAETNRNRWLWIAVAVVLLAVLVGWWLARSRQADEVEEPAADSVEVSQSAGVASGSADEQLVEEGGDPSPEDRPSTVRPASRFTRLDDISWQADADGGLRVVLLADGDIPQGNVGRFRMTGAEPREGIVLRGARQRFDREAMNVGGPRVSRIRTGLHRRDSSQELHVVFDLLEPIGARPALTFRGDKLEVLFPPL